MYNIKHTLHTWVNTISLLPAPIMVSSLCAPLVICRLVLSPVSVYDGDEELTKKGTEMRGRSRWMELIQVPSTVMRSRGRFLVNKYFSSHDNGASAAHQSFPFSGNSSASMVFNKWTGFRLIERCFRGERHLLTLLIRSLHFKHPSAVVNVERCSSKQDYCCLALLSLRNRWRGGGKEEVEEASVLLRPQILTRFFYERFFSLFAF